MAEQLELQLEFPDPPPQGLPELWTPDDLYQQISKHGADAFKDFPAEDDRIEWKSALYKPRDLADYFSMWANTQPSGGLIVVGMDKDGAVSGCLSVGTDKIAEIEASGPDHCPDAQFDVRKVTATKADGTPDYLLVFRVFYRPDRLVTNGRGEAFIRSGNKKRQLSEDEKREVRIAKGEIAYEKEPSGLTFPDDFDELLIEDFCNRYRAVRRLREPKTREQILRLNHMGTLLEGKFIPNLACAILFASDPRSVVPGAKIRILRYEGDTERTGKDYNVVRDETVDGPLPRMLQEAEHMLTSQIRYFTRLGRDGKFENNPEYPRDVWFEAIVNACVHRSYNYKNMNIFVKLSDDHLIVESPGGFVPPVTPDTVYFQHNPRNPHLMNVLFYLDYVKAAHEGTVRMRDDMLKANLPPPEFAQKDTGHNQVHVTLRNDVNTRKEFIDTRALKLIGKDVYDRLSNDEKQIVNYLAERSQANVTDIVRLLHKEWGSAKRILTRLVDSGVLLRRAKTLRERDSSAHYVLRRHAESDEKPQPDE